MGSLKYRKFGYNLIVLLFILLIQLSSYSQELKRPFILVKASERNNVLEKIETQPWAQDIYNKLLKKTDSEVDLFYKNPESYLKQLPFNWDEAQKNQFPPFYKTDHVENGVHKNLDNATDEEWKPAELLIKNLQVALDCSMIYYVTQDEKYAYVASSILYSFVKSVQKAELSNWHSRGGWLFPYDGFREVRVIGYKLPLIYDFVYPYFQNGGKSLDIIKGDIVDFPFNEAQNVFRTYADITINYGHTGSNHSVLEAPSLVYNALAMDDKKEREKLLSYFLTENTENQDALNVMAKNYKNKGDIWPETSQYLNHSTAIIAKLMLVVNKYKPELKLAKTYPNVLYALPRLDYFVYPNNEIIRWGDGHRHGSSLYNAFEDAYALAEMDGLNDLKEKFGPLINRAIQVGKYKRKDMESIFWYDDEIIGEPESFELSRTDRVYHAGIVMQRNLSSTNNPKDGLMCFVGGAHMVHGHAEGMNIELYGEGQVLGVDNGRGKYAKDIHENYSRIFAAHNTVIVNGSSQGEGGWSNLGINTVEVVSMEPQVGTKGVSPYHSFSQTTFDDNGGEKAEATQERTLALIRTSPTTGYYVDVFRSKSKLPNQFHDYLYHNIGDTLEFENSNMAFESTPEKYSQNANAKWDRGTYRNPGWHFFEEVKTSKPYNEAVKATFNVEQLQAAKIYMQMHIPGFENREYTQVKAPYTFEAPKPYDKLPTPTLVIRNKGAAWNNPFVVVYEPFNDKENATITSVSKLEQDGVYKGLKVISESPKGKLIQYIITQSKGQEFKNDALNIYFKGTLAVITLDGNEMLQNIYVGQGDKLVYKNKVINIGLGKKYYRTY
ncbi:heparinase II/III domain-containing protein [Cellulophaga tyrosinoxydans]|uniref:Heparinase II/III-like protein n=1 Tax=Cellulophaga tyrosinoxydans TaxID=504486 RepID=A0A1W2C5K1_9FLAO|nr:heparinase II/III family protein [Cellulophaga tyrosinoxydans]SMC80433.1 Heparinase II/III-like protein [Cellulophaga tyrosinoxydans]